MLKVAERRLSCFCPKMITIVMLFRTQYSLQDKQNLRHTCTCRKNLRALCSIGAQFALRRVLSNMNSDAWWVSRKFYALEFLFCVCGSEEMR
jgi:hypothetical protein